MRLPRTKAAQRDVLQRLSLYLATVSPPPDMRVAVQVLQIVIGQMYSRPAVTHAKVSSTPMSPQIAMAIRRMHYNNPDMTYMDIAATVGVNSGRVSEVLAGKRQ
jgi:hypothetical protein